MTDGLTHSLTDGLTTSLTYGIIIGRKDAVFLQQYIAILPLPACFVLCGVGLWRLRACMESYRVGQRQAGSGKEAAA